MGKTIDKKAQVEDWSELERTCQMVREASGQRRREILNKLYVPLLREYTQRYGAYNPLRKPKYYQKFGHLPLMLGSTEQKSFKLSFFYSNNRISWNRNIS